MIQIKLPEKLPEEIEQWKKEAEKITGLILAASSLEARHKLIKKHEKHWRNEILINWLSDISNEKCWYTETKFGGDYQELEHFRPKKGTRERNGKDHTEHFGYYWLAFDLDNYRLCKRRPNAKKGTFFPIVDERYRAYCADDDYCEEHPFFLDPLDEEDALLITFNDNGTPCPCFPIEKQDEERVLFTIEKYYLDERILNIRRAETWETARALFYKYQNSMNAANASGRDKPVKRNQGKNDLKTLKNMLSRDKEFSAVARAALQKTNDSMALKILAQPY